MWKKLSSQFEQAAAENKYALLQRFFDYRFQKQHRVMDHITAIETLAAQLSDIGCPQTEAEIITKIICTLPPSLKSVRSDWENVDDPKKTLQLLTIRLLKEESYNQEYEGSQSDAAFFAKQTQSVNQEASSSRRNVTCDYCDLKGHTEAKCWKKAREMSETSQAKFARSSGGSEAPPQPKAHSWSGDYVFQCIISSHTGPRDINWLVDSGASQHMSDQRWAFVNYQPVKPGCWPVNRIGENRKPLYVHGHGSVPISSLVEGCWHNGALQEVLYVPKLGANLFSVRSAALNGFAVNFLGERVEVIKNGKILAVGASTSNNLYRLSMVTGHGATKLLRPQESFAALARPNLHSIQLWPQRLGHVCTSTIKKMAAFNMADGLMISEEKQEHLCED